MLPPKPELSLIRNATWASETHFELPEWVAWLAQDADGTWWGYEATPNEQHNGWYENEIGRYLRLHQDQPNANWQASLCKVK